MGRQSGQPAPQAFGPDGRPTKQAALNVAWNGFFPHRAVQPYQMPQQPPPNPFPAMQPPQTNTKPLAAPFQSPKNLY